MTKIKNLSGSPFDIQTLSGPAIIEAFGTLEAEFENVYLDLLLACRTIALDDESPVKKKAAPESSNENDAEKLYEALAGKKPDGRWTHERLAKEIAKLKKD